MKEHIIIDKSPEIEKDSAVKKATIGVTIVISISKLSMLLLFSDYEALFRE